MLVMSWCLTSFLKDLKENGTYIVDYQFFDPRLRGVDYRDNIYFPPKLTKDTAQVFYEKFHHRFGYYPSGSDGPRILATTSVFHQAVELSRSLNISDLNKAMAI